MEIEALIEIPRGSRNKYEVNHETGEIWLDRLLFTATQYPTDYGFIPHTLAEDGDPLDVMVLMDEPTFPGCHIHIRPIGLFVMSDEKGEDAKVLGVPVTDPRWDAYQDIEDVPEYWRSAISHFFAIYKDLEPGKRTDVKGWSGADAAARAVDEARERYRTG